MVKQALEKHIQLLNKYSKFVKNIFSNLKIKKPKEQASCTLTVIKCMQMTSIVF